MTNHVSKLHDKIPTYPIYNTVAGVRQESGVEPSVLLQCNGGTENLVNVVKFPKIMITVFLNVFHDSVASAKSGRTKPICILAHTGLQSLMEMHTQKLLSIITQTKIYHWAWWHQGWHLRSLEHERHLWKNRKGRFGIILFT